MYTDCTLPENEILSVALQLSQKRSLRICCSLVLDALAKKYHITKYPTLKMFRNGQLAKREYRSQRSKDAFLKYLREQMADPIHRMQTQEDLQKIDVSTFSCLHFQDVSQRHPAAMVASFTYLKTSKNQVVWLACSLLLTHKPA